MRALLALSLLLLASAVHAQPSPLFLHLEADKARGVVEVNGAPALDFPSPGMPEGLAGPDQTAFPLLPWLEDGANEIVVRLHDVAPEGYVQAGVSPSPMVPPDEQKKATAPGEFKLQATGSGMPKWSWHAAEA